MSDEKEAAEEKKFQPIAISPSLASALPKLYGGHYFKISEDGATLVEWNYNFPVPSEDEALARVQSGWENFLIAHGNALIADGERRGTITKDIRSAILSEMNNKTVREVSWPSIP
jgi:hypothetical protein